MGGAAPAFGPDGAGQNWIYLTTANGTFDGNTNWGDSFLKLNPNGLTIPSHGFFTPADQSYRSVPQCNARQSGDMDFGSGGVTLIPDNTLANWGYLALNGEKEGSLWFMRRDLPGGFTGSFTPCQTNQKNNNVQAYSTGIQVIHNNLAFWQAGTDPNRVPYVYIGQQNGGLAQYTLCPYSNATNPICGTGGGLVAKLPGVSNGVTPTISAATPTDTDAILWALEKTDGGRADSTGPGVLFAFDAVNMTQLYTSNNTACPADNINQATKYSVPTVANGYVYLGTQSPNTNSQNTGLGTFYIFGPGRSCQQKEKTHGVVHAAH